MLLASKYKELFSFCIWDTELNTKAIRNHAEFFILLPLSLRGILLHSKLSERHVI